MFMKTGSMRLYIFITFLLLGLYFNTNAQTPVTKPSSPVQPAIATTIPGSRCGAGRVQLHASARNPADTIKWYKLPAGGSSLGKGESWTTPVISSSTTYYVSASKKGHTSARKAVKATVNAL